MTKKCSGCGAILQSINQKDKGYIPPNKITNSNYCERCFQIIHYNKKIVTELKNINDYIKNIVNKKAEYVYFLIDFININKETINTFQSINVSKTLIISKTDIIPKSIKEPIIVNWLKENYNVNENIIFQSTKKNINTKLITKKLEEQNINECYILGYTNAGKSTLINKLCCNEKENYNEITTSLIPNTTIDFIKIKLNDNLSIIDSPGFTLTRTIYNEDEFELIKKVNPKNFLKPTTYQLKDIASILIEDKIRLKSSINNSLTFYISNDIKTERVFEKNRKLTDLAKKEIKIPANSDLVIKSLGFINVKKACTLTIHANDFSLFEVRTSMFKGKQ